MNSQENKELVMSPDLILYNAKIITVDEKFTIAQAVAIKDGRFVAVGASNQILSLARESTKTLDLEGKTVIPGFIDGHFRLLDRATAQKYGANISLSESVGDILDAVREAAARIPKGQVITSNSGWFPQMLQEGRDPTKEELDAVAPEHPVILRGEYIYLNSYALKQFKITKNTPQPEYGWIEKDPVTGEPTGVLMGDAAKLLDGVHLKFSAEQKRNALLWALGECAKAGVTSIREGGISIPDLRFYHQLYREGKLPIRVSAQLSLNMSLPISEILSNFEQFYLNNPFGDRWFQIDRASYIFADDEYNRSNLSTPIYNQRVPEERVRRFHSSRDGSTEKIEQIITGMAKLGISGGILAGGDLAIDEVLDILDRVNDLYPLSDRRWIISQLFYPQERHLAKMKKLGVVLTPMWHHYYYYPALEVYHGKTVAQTMDPFKMLIESGVPVGLGSDISSIPLNYFTAIYFLHTRNTWKWGLVNPDQGISREQALRLLTINNAYVTFEEKEKGSIECGKLADLVVISDDIMTVTAEKIPLIKPLLTIINGQVVYSVWTTN
ncbi:amidohydrolase [Chrysosporum bergii ANA360D]|jgi:predicted amidohydrolase YtcJ|uniref:Amidohydrolase n=1 Tax=Chrysosporum bergii ANA360D TaxID=617107 RepID=A0AA43GSG2_9CYAN|nr:amidohydrolase [Chrysosporum bergii]MDH6060620.1 amidohydrolase [Chrysosporum bergii ANA360D]